VQERLRVTVGNKQMQSESKLEIKSEGLTLGTHATWPKVAIIVLNWNGWRDTIECLESLQQITYPNYEVIVVDNGSTDNSVGKIKEWASGGLRISSRFVVYDPSTKPLRWIEYSKENPRIDGQVCERDTTMEKDPQDRCLVFIETGENLGFATGSNVGIRYALEKGFDYIFLLNNDTVVTQHTLSRLVSFLEKNAVYDVATASIFYYSKPDDLWNAGGRLTVYGSRTYYTDLRRHKRCEARRVTFVSGCAVMIRKELLQKHGLLSEDFFFGEEDYEFSLRMKRTGVRMACVHTARIYHKIGQSSKNLFDHDSVLRAFMHLLNRCIDLKHIYWRPYWHIWRLGLLLYAVPRLCSKHDVSAVFLFKFSYKFLKYSAKYDNVRRDVYEELRRQER